MQYKFPSGPSSMWSRQLANSLAFTVLLIAAIARAQPALPEQTSSVEMQIKGADGKPAVNTAVEVMHDGDFVSGRKKSVLKLTSDQEGWVRFNWSLGVATFRVRAPGIGYTTTAVVVRADATAHAPLPRLVAYGKIVGVVPEDLRLPEMSFEIKDWRSDEIFSRADCDVDGRFSLTDVPPGSYWLRPMVKGKPAKIHAPVRVSAGQTVSEVAFQPVDDAAARNTPTQSIEERIANGKKPAVWATGRVVDAAGIPVVNAEVFAIITWIGIREVEEVESTRTDALGNWQIVGASRHSSHAGYIVVSADGRPPQSVVLPSRFRVDADGQAIPLAVRELGDTVLPTRGGSLSVTVKDSGKPSVGTSVFLLRENAFPRNRHPHSDSDEDGIRSHEILTPIAETDQGGLARFTNLLPGSYTIRAVNGMTKEYVRGALSLWDRPFLNNPRGRWASASGIRVGVGDTTKWEMALDQPNYMSSVQIIRGDSKPLMNERLGVSWRRPHELGGRSSSAIAAHDGKLQLGFLNDPGLWLVAFQDPDYEVRSIPIRQLPYHEAQGLIACSTLLENAPDQHLTSVFRTVERKARTLIVRLEDDNGNPLQGEVFLNRAFSGPCGSTDEEGEVRFDNLTAAGEITAEMASELWPQLAKQKSLPSDDELIGKRVFLDKRVESLDPATTTITMRPIRVGYLRGQLQPKPPLTFADYELFVSNAVLRPAWNVQYDRQTGQFVTGPFAEGQQSIQLGFKTPDGKAEVCPIPDVQVRSDKVVNVTCTPLISDRKARSQSWYSNLHLRQFQGSVLAADGESAVLGATVALFLPQIDRAVHRCDADERGFFLLATTSIPGRQATSPDPNPITVPTLVARIPGSCGATVLPLSDPDEAPGQPLNLVLPKPQSLRGRVTVGGDSIQSFRATFVVRAQYLGRGELNDELSIQTTPSLDGSFELGGLTPGKYQIQAAMDNIWLSNTIAMDVVAEPTVFGRMQLLIPAPGQATVLELTDQDGRPLVDLSATIDRPPGPLTERLWPKSLISDGAGRVHLPPLEVGTHRVTFGGSTTVAKIEVPPLRSKPAVPIKILLQVHSQQND